MINAIQNSEHYTWGNNCDGWHLLKSDSLSVIEEQMPTNTEEALHFHRHSQQVFYILAGKANFEINGQEYIVNERESIHIPKMTLHRISNKQIDNLQFLVISEPKAHGDRIEFINYSEENKEAIKLLNYEWLEKYAKVEAGDIVSLSDPKVEIIDKGGFIFYAKMNGEIVGTASLLKKSKEIFELGKMAVTESKQGLGIGNMLIEHCISVAKQNSISRLILYSNTVLSPAIHLYKKYGFEEITLEQGLYERANIKMEKRLSNN